MANVGSITISAGNRRGIGLSGVPWWRRGALVDADFAGRRFYYSGAYFANETAWLAAIGGSKAGEARSIGPYVASAAPELLTNADFASGTTDWATHDGGTISVVGGDMVLEANGGNNPDFSQSFVSTYPKGYRLTARCKRGTAPNGPLVLVTTSANLTGVRMNTATVAGTAFVEEAKTFGHEAVTYVGGQIGGSAVTGNAVFDLISVKEAVPFAGLAAGKLAFEIAGTTPATASGNKVLAQWGDDSERNRLRLVWGADSRFHLIDTTAGTLRGDIDLGVVAVSTAFTITVSLAENRLVAALNGDNAKALISSIFVPGLSKLWLGRSFTGEAWDGTIKRFAAWSDEHLPARAIYGEGDSYWSGAGGVSLATSLNGFGRGAVYTATGGSTLTQQLARVLANPGLRTGIFVYLDGDANGYGTLASDMAQYAAMFNALGHQRFIVVPPLRRANKTSGDNAATLALQAALAVAYPANVLDGQAILAAHATAPGDNTTVAAGHIPASLLQSDGTHLLSPAMGYIAAGVDAMIAAKGW